MDLVFYVPAESSIAALGKMRGLPVHILTVIVEFLGSGGEDWASLSLTCKSLQFVVSDWRFKSFKSFRVSAKSPTKALYCGSRLPQNHPNYPRLKHAVTLVIFLQNETDDLEQLQVLLLGERGISDIFPALKRIVFTSDGTPNVNDVSALLAAMNLPRDVVPVFANVSLPSVLPEQIDTSELRHTSEQFSLENFNLPFLSTRSSLLSLRIIGDQNVETFNVDDLPPTLQRLSIEMNPTADLIGALPTQLRHLVVLLAPFDPPRFQNESDEQIRNDYGKIFFNDEERDLSNEEDDEERECRRVLMLGSVGMMGNFLEFVYNVGRELRVGTLDLRIVPTSLQTLELLFQEEILNLELPTFGEPESVRDDLANRLDEKFRITGSLQHATSLRLVRCKVLYSGEVPTHSPLELDRLRDHVSSRCKAAANVVFQVSSVKKANA